MSRWTMVVGVDEVAAGRVHRVLRRSLVITALVAGGWLCGALFASTASATEAPPTERPPSGLTGYLGAVTTTVTNTVTNTVTDAVTNTVTAAVYQADRTAAALTRGAVAVPPAVAEPAHRPAVPPTAPAVPVEPSGAERAAVAPGPTAPLEPPATPALPVTVAPAAEHPPRVPVDPTSRRASASGAPESVEGTAVLADRQADDDVRSSRHVPGQPDRAPIPAPVGSSGYTAHDTTAGGRGVLAVLTDSAPRSPPAAGHTTRSRAADATGRVAGLPATTPD